MWPFKKKKEELPLISENDPAIAVGDKVLVFDRYRFAIPIQGEILRFSDSNDGVEVALTGHTNNPHYKTGSTIWVHLKQLELQR